MDIDRARIGDEVAALMRRVAAAELLPRWGTAPAHEKAPGELVTEADLAAEAMLTDGLRRLLPGAAVIGEEGVHADPGLLDGLSGHARAWVVDPLDGTRHFARGDPEFGIMIALLVDGECQAGWIHLPITDQTAIAWRGHGTTLDGRPARVPPLAAEPQGTMHTGFFPEPLKNRVDALQRGASGRPACSAWQYLSLVRGEDHYVGYWRTLPWDHAPGALILEEAGGAARRFDGTPYRAVDIAGTGLLAASSPDVWARTHERFLQH